MSCPVQHSSGDTVVLDSHVTDRHAERERLYQAGPVTRVTLPGGVRAWATTHHEVTRATLTDPRLVKDIAHWDDFQNGRIPQGWPLMATIPMEDTSVLGADGGPHRRLRDYIAKPFSARRIEKLRPLIEEMTTELLDAMEYRAHEPLDLRAEFTFLIPMGLIGALYGLDRSEYATLGGLYARIFDETSTPEDFQKSWGILVAYYQELIDHKRQNPGEDLTTDLVSATEDGKPALTDAEIIDNLMVIVAAGHETTVNLLNNAVRALLSHPEQFDLVKKGEVGWEAVVEETLRYDPPNSLFMFRFATEDVEIGDVTIRRGEALLSYYAGTSRDRAEFGEESDVGAFDLTRSQGRHISFGYGPHICPGASLARMEGQLILPMLFDRYPDLELAVPDEELETIPSIVLNSVKELPVVLRP